MAFSFLLLSFECLPYEEIYPTHSLPKQLGTETTSFRPVTAIKTCSWICRLTSLSPSPSMYFIEIQYDRYIDILYAFLWFRELCVNRCKRVEFMANHVEHKPGSVFQHLLRTEDC